MNVFRSDSLFSRFMNMLFDSLFAGVLWLVCCIPVVTAGAAATAAYYTTAKSVRRKAGYVFREFKHSFKSNFRQTLFMTLSLLLIYVILAVDIWYVWVNDSKLNSALFMALLLVLFCVMSVTVWFFPLLSRFDKRNLDMVRMAGFVAFRYLPITIGLILMFIAACILVFLMPWAILVMPGLYLLGISYPVEYVLKKLMPPVEEGSEEAEKWYYQ